MSEQHCTPKNILIIEDNPATSTILSHIVRDLGYIPITASCGEEAKERLALNEFALCLLDLNLPDINGQRLCKYIRARTAVPLVVLSAEDDVDVIIKLLEIGADDYIVKPAHFSVVKVTILAQMRRAAIAKPVEARRKNYDPFYYLSLIQTDPSGNSRLH